MAEAPAPLAGVRVLDLTRYVAGPFATQLLADYGADVVKVESRKGREFRALGPAGHHHPLSSPYGRFRARDGWLNIAAGGPGMFEKLSHALDRRAWLEDARFADPLARLRHRDQLTAAMEEVLASGDVEAWVERINAAGVPAGPVLDLSQVFADPQVLAREMLVGMPHPEVGTFRSTGLAVKLSRTPGRIVRRPPLLGEHSDEVLRECDFSDADIARLRQQAVI